MGDANITTKPWRSDNDGMRLFIHLTPKTSRDHIGEVIVGVGGAVLKVRVRALPDKGQANQALIKLLSKWLGVPKTSLELLSGSRSRQKCVKIYGKNPEILKLLETRIE